jgi:hypothetical protein
MHRTSTKNFLASTQDIVFSTFSLEMNSQLIHTNVNTIHHQGCPQLVPLFHVSRWQLAGMLHQTHRVRSWHAKAIPRILRFQLGNFWRARIISGKNVSIVLWHHSFNIYTSLDNIVSDIPGEWT